MEFLVWLWHNAASFFHLSPLDYVIAFFVVVLTFYGHILELAQLAGKKHLEFVRWRVEYRKELAKLKRSEQSELEPVAEAKPRLSA